MREEFYNANLQYYDFPIPVKKALAIFGAHGYRAYVVGGAVRDIFRGVPVHDWDIAAETSPDMTKQLFSAYRCYDTGIKHGTVTVNIDGELIEITTFRTDGEYKDSRHPENVIFTNSLYEDLKRRDFTINAMAFNLYMDLEDPYGGMSDLSANLIRAVGDPVKRFTEDALRIMRAYRFSATLLFDIDERTLEASRTCAGRLANISRERINEEWKKLLSAEFCGKTLVTMKKYGVMGAIFPEVSHSDEYLMGIEKLPADYILRSAAFFKAIPSDKIPSAAARINFTSNELTSVRSVICAYKDIAFDPYQNLRRYCYLNSIFAFRGAALANHVSELSSDTLSEISRIMDDPSMIWSRKELKINGNDILSAYPVSPRDIGRITDELVLRIVDGTLSNERNALLSEVGKIIKR